MDDQNTNQTDNPKTEDQVQDAEKAFENEVEDTRGDAEEPASWRVTRTTNDSEAEDGRRDTAAAGPRAEEPELEQPQEEQAETSEAPANEPALPDDPNSPAKWYVVHTYSGHENKVAAALKQRIESEHLEDKILQILVPTQEKIEIRSGKKETVKEKIFPGYILVKMILDDSSWLAVRTTQGVTAFIGMGNKPTPISETEVKSIVNFMEAGAQPTYKQIFAEGDTVKIIDGPFAEFIGKIDSVDKERGKVKVLVSIFGRETPVELDFLQVAKL